MSDKGIQYKPYDALKGFQTSLREKEKTKITKPVLAGDKIEEIRQTLNYLSVKQKVRVKYFDVNDIKVIEGEVKKIDKNNKKITILSIVINFNDILDISVSSLEDY